MIIGALIGFIFSGIMILRYISEQFTKVAHIKATMGVKAEYKPCPVCTVLNLAVWTALGALIGYIVEFIISWI